MNTPNGYLATVTAFDALPVLIASGEIAMVTKLEPSESGAKTMLLLRSGERVMTGTEYQAIADRLAEDVEKNP